MKGNRIFRSLVTKEFRQMLRDKRIIVLLLVTPTIQLLTYGLALSPDVKNLQLGVVDFAKTPQSRELVSALVSNHVFDIAPSGRSVAQLYSKVDSGDLDAGLVIPPEFAREIAGQKTAVVQVALSAVDANTAGIAAAYIAQIIGQFNRQMLSISSLIVPDITFIYNPGLISSWFFVPAVIAMSLTIAGTLVSTSTLLREKESGTMDQLLMTPASATQMLLAKVVPLFVVLFAVVNVSLCMGMLIFHVPMRGSYLLFLATSLEYMFVLIALGLALATYAANQRQAMLTTFFFMMPLIQLSGAVSPIESMPMAFRYLSVLDPLRFYISCLRGILLKGNGVAELWQEMLVLLLFAVVFMSVSASRFRKQLI